MKNQIIHTSHAISLCKLAFLFLSLGTAIAAEQRPIGRELKLQAQGDSVVGLLCPDGFQAMCTAIPQNCPVDPRTQLDRKKQLVQCNGVWLPIQKSKPVLK